MAPQHHRGKRHRSVSDIEIRVTTSSKLNQLRTNFFCDQLMNSRGSKQRLRQAEEEGDNENGISQAANDNERKNGNKPTRAILEPHRPQACNKSKGRKQLCYAALVSYRRTHGSRYARSESMLHSAHRALAYNTQATAALPVST